jgi:hypothetical protein
MIEELVKITDSHGFVYEVLVRHYPHRGISIACYKDMIICAVGNDCKKIFEPSGDNDKEWEIYEQLLENYKNSAIADIVPTCIQFFDDLLCPVNNSSSVS